MSGVFFLISYIIEENMEHIVGYKQVEGVQRPMFSDSPTYVREILENVEMSFRMVPCRAVPGLSKYTLTEHVKDIKDSSVRKLIQSGVFFTTEGVAGSAANTTGYALFMSYRGDMEASGRGGILLKEKDGQWEPLLVTLNTSDGEKEFLLDVKGTGTPDGKLYRTEDGREIGGIEGDGDKEFASLHAAENEHPFFDSGIVPFAISKGVDSRGFDQIVRAIPASLRPSFRRNKSLEKEIQIKDSEIFSKLGREMGRYLGFQPPRIAQGIHADNAYLVDTSAGQEIVATDFADIDVAYRLPYTLHALENTIKVLFESAKKSDVPESFVWEGLFTGIRELRPELNLSGEDLNKIDPACIVDYLLEKYLAKELIEARRKASMNIEMNYITNNIYSFDREMIRDFPETEVHKKILQYLIEERRILYAYLKNESHDGLATEAFTHVDTLVERLNDESKHQLFFYNYEEYFDLLPISY
jgi:hypothetical protein